jgi:hypothetical protein
MRADPSVMVVYPSGTTPGVMDAGSTAGLWLWEREGV